MLTLGAICLPIKPITEISKMFPVINKAWHSESSQTFLFIFVPKYEHSWSIDQKSNKVATVCYLQ
ncbi:hypothetical protein VCRA2116O426_170044 [Vibrio crassostreae]|nr:hypothetical protein VCRA2116O426_170044 [Vibrio crassostreae]